MFVIELHVFSWARDHRDCRREPENMSQAHKALDPACKIGTVHGNGGSIMVWGVFSWHCLGSLMRVPTSLSAIRYVEFLGNHLRVFVLFCFPHATKERPDLNHIKHLWNVLEQGGKGHHTPPTNLNELWWRGHRGEKKDGEKEEETNKMEKVNEMAERENMSA
ncbi:transposable element Tc1 transposase [Trichonephila clavipes]|nr:transposable element Tc1 transposase [Trichonephila clavipes]